MVYKAKFKVNRRGLHKVQSDHPLFIKSDHDDTTMIVIYVDDIIIAGSSETRNNKAKNILKSHFDMKDLGKLRYFLGLEIIQSNKRIFMNKKKYILDLLREIDWGKRHRYPNGSGASI